MDTVSTQDTDEGSHADTSKVKYSYITAESNFTDHRTKIVCTMGPTCS